MKKLLFILLLPCLLFSQEFGQNGIRDASGNIIMDSGSYIGLSSSYAWNFGATGIYSSGNVGIKTSAVPTQAFEINGGLRVYGNIAAAEQAGAFWDFVSHINTTRFYSKGTATVRGNYQLNQIETDGQNNAVAFETDSDGNTYINGTLGISYIGLDASKPTATTGMKLVAINNTNTSDNCYASIISGNAGFAGLFFGDAENDDQSGFRFYHPEGNLSLKLNDLYSHRFFQTGVNRYFYTLNRNSVNSDENGTFFNGYYSTTTDGSEESTIGLGTRTNGADVTETVCISTRTIVDDGEVTPVAAGMAGYGTIVIGDNEAWASFTFASDGSVTIEDSKGSVVNTDTDANLCIYDKGTQIGIKNRLGGTRRCHYDIHYYPPTI